MSPSRPVARIAIADYGMGNRRSVQKALEHVGAEVSVTADAAVIASADGVVVPGVGAFPAGMENLRRCGLDAVLRDRAAAGQPILGICLGMQLLFDASEEGSPTSGLGLIPGTVTRLRTGGLRIPHIGWNDVRFERPSRLTAALSGTARSFYHVHSYAVRPERAGDVVATTEYGERFATIVEAGAVSGVQFHPEKSSADGLALLSSFVSVASESGRPQSSAPVVQPR